MNCFPPMSCYATLAVGVDLRGDKGCAVIMDKDDHDPKQREASQVLAGIFQQIAEDCKVMRLLKTDLNDFVI